jgi:hypothetical protein
VLRGGLAPAIDGTSDEIAPSIRAGQLLRYQREIARGLKPGW